MKARPGDLKISTRVYLGFALLALAAVLHAYVGERAASDAEEALALFEVTLARSSAVQDLRVQVVELQRDVQLYTSSGHAAVVGRTRARLESIRAGLDQLDPSSSNEEERKIIGRLLGYVEAYERGFNFAVEERTRRDKLVKQTLPDLETRVQRELGPNGEAATGAAARVAFQCRLNIRQYLTDPDYSLLEATESSIQALADSPEIASDARLLLDEYQGTFRRIVQATRGYLFLVNVVLAGQATEFSYDVSKFDGLAESQVERLKAQVDTSSKQSHQFSLYFSLAALVASSWLAWMFRSTVARPLLEITGTLNRLSKGERAIRIPGADRRDEIGVMAQAAEVFLEQNKQTAALLAETQQLAARLDENRGQLEQSNQELEQFVYTASHDLKSPLVTSAGFLGMTRDLLENGEVTLALEKMTTVERAHARMNQILADLLELSRVGETDMDRSQLDLNALVSTTLDGMRERFPGARFELESLPSVVANESRILQVFENLLGNAMKYAGPQAHIRIGSRVQDGQIHYFVADNGPGIPPELHDQIFGLFQRLSSKTEGTGVGLAIVARVMKTHNGRVWVESKGTNDGATFWLAFEDCVVNQRTAA